MVPRTFVGPIIVSGIAYPFVALSRLLGVSKFFAQYAGELLLQFHKFKVCHRKFNDYFVSPRLNRGKESVGGILYIMY